jgi:hypothetical protein
MSQFTGGNVQPYWLGTYPITASGVTTPATVTGKDGQGATVNTTIQTVPTFIVNNNPGTGGGITINGLTNGTPSSFSTVLLSTGSYWMYCDIAATSNVTGWGGGDSVNFWVSDQTSYSATTSNPAWPDLAVRPYYQSFTLNATTAGTGQTSMNYSGWVNITQNSKLYNNVQFNGTGTNANKYQLFNWSYQKMA